MVGQFLYNTAQPKENGNKTDTKDSTAHNMGFAKMGADGSRGSTFCFSIWLHTGQDVINLAMYKSSTFIYKFSFS